VEESGSTKKQDLDVYSALSSLSGIPSAVLDSFIPSTGKAQNEGMLELTMATKTYTDTAIQICVFTAFSEVP